MLEQLHMLKKVLRDEWEIWICNKHVDYNIYKFCLRGFGLIFFY
jgi:hypothetical protein